MQFDALRVVAHLGNSIGGDAPHLDGLLVYSASPLVGKDAAPGYKIDRSSRLPERDVSIPMLRTKAGPFLIPRCTSPILGEVENDRHEYIAKRIGVEHAELIAPDERRVVTTTNGWTKSYRLPLRVRDVQRVAWLCVGDRREMLKLLNRIASIGKKGSHGFGRVNKWAVDRIGEVPHDYWPWWINSESGPVLMRPLPQAAKLPRHLVGAMPTYAAVRDPYWHADRHCEAVVPC